MKRNGLDVHPVVVIIASRRRGMKEEEVAYRKSFSGGRNHFEKDDKVAGKYSEGSRDCGERVLTHGG